MSSSIVRQLIIVALNASIEAARAGAMGRGFAVVAEEMRSLSVSAEKLAQDFRSGLYENDLITTTTFQDMQAGGKMVVGALTGLELQTRRMLGQLQPEGAHDQRAPRNGFDQMVMRGMRSALVREGGAVGRAAARASPGAAAASQAAVLSIASLVFRMLIVIYFDDDRATRAHFAALSRQAADEMSHQAFIDAICEAGNLCCGGVNRDLGTVFPWVGMSTPTSSRASACAIWAFSGRPPAALPARPGRGHPAARHAVRERVRGPRFRLPAAAGLSSRPAVNSNCFD
jgi:hypothetical protein